MEPIETDVTDGRTEANVLWDGRGIANDGQFASSDASGQCPARDDVQLPGAELDVPVAQLDRQPAGDDEEEVVGVRVRMPDELAARLRELELVVVVVADDPRLEGLVEGGELPGEVDGLLH